MSKFKHHMTNNIVCPYCGYENINSWEVESGEQGSLGLIECGNCGKEFYATRDVEVTYTTHQAKYGTCTGCGAKNVVIEDYHSSIGKYHDLCTKCGYEQEKLFRAAEIERINKEIESERQAKADENSGSN